MNPFRLARILAVIGTFAFTASAQQSLPAPRLDAVFPFSGQAGGKPFEMVVNGDELEGPQQLLFTHPGIKAEPVMLPADRFYPAPRPVENRFVVTIPSDVPAGFYEVRLANRMGASNARRFVVGAEPESVEVEPNNDPKTATPVAVGSAVSGRTDPQQRDYFRIAGKKGERLTIHCAARCADSLADVALVLSDTSGNVLRRARDPVRLDPTIDFTPPADGDYFVAVNDFVWTGGEKHPYRLSITTGPWVEFIDPPVAVAGTTTKHTVYGRNLPGGTPASSEMNPAGEQLEKVEVSITAPADPSSLPPPTDTDYRPTDGPLDAISFRLPGPDNTFSNPVRVAVVRGAVVAEAEPNDKPEQAQLLSLPATVVTRSNPRNDRDWFGFDAKKGEKLWIEVISRRLGQPTDPAVVVQRVETDKDGKQTLKDVAEFDDAKRLTENAEDPRLRFEQDDVAALFTVPQDGAYRLMLRDLFSGGRAGPNCFQVLAIRKPEPDFALHAHVGRPDLEDAARVPAALTVRKGGSTTIEVAGFRRDGFDGDVKIAMEGLPAGVTAAPVVMSGRADSATVVLQASPDAAKWTGPVRVTGTGTLNGAEVTRVAAVCELTTPKVEGVDVNLRAERLVCGALVLCVRDDLTAPWSAGAGAGKVWRMARGGKIDVPVTVSRTAGFSGEVKLDPLVSISQVRPGGPVTFAGNESEKKLTLEIDPAAKPGTVTVPLRGVTTVKYSRGSEIAKQAGEDEKRIQAIHEADKQGVQKAQQALKDAEQAVQQWKQKVAEAERNRTAAVQRMAEADGPEKGAAEKLAHAVSALDTATKALQAAEAAAAAAPPADEAVKRSVMDARRQLTEKTVALIEAAKLRGEAAAAAKAAADQLSAAAKAGADADASLTAGGEVLRAAMSAEQKAQAAEKESAAARQGAERRSAEVRRLAEPRDVRVYGYASPAVIEVVDSPWTATLSPAEIVVKAGAPMPTEVAVTLAREFDFNGDVKFELAPPEGASGLAFAENGNVIAAGQAAGTLKFRADANAKPGEFTWTLRGRYAFNNRGDLTVERPLKVTVMPTDPKGQ